VDKVSVIIRCKNEEMWIGHAIQSVVDFFPGSEIIVVDNNSTDDSMDIVRGFEKWNNIVRLNIDNYSPGSSLNKGVFRAKHEKILVLSSHCVIKQVNERVFENLDVHGYVAVFGNQIPVYRGRRISKRYIWSHFGEERIENMYSEIENRSFLHNAFCFYNRDFLLKFRFDEKLYGKEDRYWAIDMVNKGKKFLYDPELIVEHHWTPNGATWKGIG